MGNMAEQRWYAFVVLAPASRQRGHWSVDRAWVHEQTNFVRSIAPAMGARRWFFRRSGALDSEVTSAERPRSMRLCVELARSETVDGFAGGLGTALPTGWKLKSWRDWNPRFHAGLGSEYGSVEAQEVFMVGLCSALTRSIATGCDPKPWAIGHWIEELLGTRDPREIARLLSIPTM